MVNCEELVGTTEYLTLYARCHINRCRYSRVRLYAKAKGKFVRSCNCTPGVEGYGVVEVQLHAYLTWVLDGG
jgi:hypothetical protein